MRNRAQGSILIETALILPLLILVLLGVLQVGALLYTRHNLFNIAYNGVRIAATNPKADTSTVQSYIKQELSTFNISTAQIVISPSDFTQADRGSLLELSISVDLSQLLLFSLPVNWMATSISVSASMAKEY